MWNGSMSNLWSEDRNWDVAPEAGNDLLFPAGAANETNTNDLSAATGFGKLTLEGSGYVIGGNSIALTGAVDVSQSSGSDQVNLPIDFAANPASVTVDQSGASLLLGGVISGTGGLTKAGAGTLTLSGANNYTGTTAISAGVLNVNSVQGASPVTIAAGAQLGGSGTVGTITDNGGVVSPGAPAPAILTDSGDLDLSAASTYSVALNGTTAGSGYSQLDVSGMVNLAGATLKVTDGFTPTGNAQFTIISNKGGNAVSGTFAGLAEGATLEVGNDGYRISYVGGAGHDVVLTHLGLSTTTVSSSSSSVSHGQTVNLTATVASADSTITTTPTGMVQFFNGMTSLGTATLSSGTGTLSNVTLPVGTASVTAMYQGDNTFDDSTSSPITITVTTAAPTISVSGSPAPSVFGQSVTLTATLSGTGGSPTGTVTFLSGGITLGTATLSSGSASVSTTTLPVGSDTILAQYSGDTNFSAGSSSATQTVNQASTTTTLTATPTTASAGQPVTLAATVAAISPGAGTPTGTITFMSGSTALGTASVGANGYATLTTVTLPAGSNSIIAQYSGDSNFRTSSSSSAAVLVSQGTVSVTLSGLIQKKKDAYSNVEFTITVAAPAGATTPTGTVNVFSNGLFIGSRSLTSGKATFDTIDLMVGTDSVTASYLGDSNYSPTGNSAPLTVTVGTSNQLYVNQLYLDLLDRPVDSIGLQVYGGQLDNGVTKKKVEREIKQSPEHKALVRQSKTKPTTHTANDPGAGSRHDHEGRI
jgi:autotransporter-associated beta strand protein